MDDRTAKVNQKFNNHAMNERLVDFYNTHKASQKPVGVFGLKTATDIRLKSGLPWLPLKLPFWAPFDIMLKEVRKLRECFVPHRSQNEDHHGWYSLCIHGLSSVHTNIASHYGLEEDHDWTEICKFCPVTHAFFRDMFGYIKYGRIRFMLLEPGGYILPHKDTNLDRLNVINIALNNPINCHFVMKDCGIVPFVDGSAIMLNLSREHIVWNRSNEDRYHIIVHGERDPIIWDKIICDR